MTGYQHSLYAKALAEFGDPVRLSSSGGWLIQRPISNTRYVDAMGCYPILSCPRWADLKADLSLLDDRLVCVYAVTDPFGDFSLQTLSECFATAVKPYKKHFVVDLNRESFSHIAKHHQRNISKAHDNDIVVRQCDPPAAYADTWSELYSELINRHAIKGIAAFSRLSFSRQLQVPGTVLFCAEHNGEIVGLLWWFVQGDVAYYHLGAYNEAGYRTYASFALFWHSLHYFAQREIRACSLGAGAGVENDGNDGLTRFKKGWATGTRPTWFCSHIFNQQAYDELVKARVNGKTDFFPAYRAGEFT